MCQEQCWVLGNKWNAMPVFVHRLPFTGQVSASCSRQMEDKVKAGCPRRPLLPIPLCKARPPHSSLAPASTPAQPSPCSPGLPPRPPPASLSPWHPGHSVSHTATNGPTSPSIKLQTCRSQGHCTASSGCPTGSWNSASTKLVPHLHSNALASPVQSPQNSLCGFWDPRCPSRSPSQPQGNHLTVGRIPRWPQGATPKPLSRHLLLDHRKWQRWWDGHPLDCITTYDSPQLDGGESPAGLKKAGCLVVRGPHGKQLWVSPELRLASAWQPARRQEPPSYNYKELNFADNHLSSEEATELQKELSPTVWFYPLRPWAENLFKPCLDIWPTGSVR